MPSYAFIDADYADDAIDISPPLASAFILPPFLFIISLTCRHDIDTPLMPPIIDFHAIFAAIDDAAISIAAFHFAIDIYY